MAIKIEYETFHRYQDALTRQGQLDDLPNTISTKIERVTQTIWVLERKYREISAYFTNRISEPGNRQVAFYPGIYANR